MKTFILEWNPEISSYRMDAFEQDMHYIEYGEFNWSVWDWKSARSGDNFYIIKCGEGKTGIVMKGFFTSEPYEAEDWSGRNREVHYMDLRPTFMIHPNHPKGIISTQRLEETFPEFEWNGGHSGRLLPENLASGLDKMWTEFAGQFGPKDADGRTLEMNYIPEAGIDDAISVASEAHYDQLDEDGRPVILGVLEKGLSAGTDFERICGFLSRVLAESDISAGTLRERGFSERTVDVLTESLLDMKSSS